MQSLCVALLKWFLIKEGKSKTKLLGGAMAQNNQPNQQNSPRKNQDQEPVGQGQRGNQNVQPDFDKSPNRETEQSG